VIDEFRMRLLNGMRAKGLTAEFAEGVFRQIKGFGEYGFPESHAASFALLAYVSAYLKCHYPAAFCAALLNSQPMGFYAPAQLVRDAKEHGVNVLPIDVNSSRWDCTLENGSVRLGYRMAVGMRKSEALLIEQALPFRSMAEFRRSGVSASTVEQLARADAFGSLALSRRDPLWQSLRPPSTTPMFADAEEDESPIELPSMGQQQEVLPTTKRLGCRSRRIRSASSESS
jgi:error-prone DNA polymerase